MGLVRHDTDHDTWVAEDPGLVHARVVSPLSQQGAELLQESAQLGAGLQGAHPDLAARADSPSRAARSATCTEMTRSTRSWQHSSPSAEEEALTAQPQARPRCRRGLARWRTSATTSGPARARVRRSSRSTSTAPGAAASPARTSPPSAPLGAEIRTLDEFFNRMIVVDRRIAVIPSPGRPRAWRIAIREPTIVAYLVDVFMRSWERARPFTQPEASLIKDIAEEQRAMTMRMLIEGHSDPVSAKRLGVSPRTYAGYVADLKEEFEAETRFQLGYTLGRLGISGSEEPAAVEEHDTNEGSDRWSLPS